MIAHFRYLQYVIRHKWFVLVAGLRVGGIPLWRLVIHDWSKFLPSEWGPYVRFFYAPHVIGDPRGKDASYNPAAGPEWFNTAWLKHQHRQPHHWQHWVLRRDDGDTLPLRMPVPFAREMVADWMGAGRAISGKWEVREWYERNAHKMVLHESTRALVEGLL